MRKFLVALVLVLTGFSTPAFAQFGVNQVIWEKTKWNFYRSAHFDFYFSLELTEGDVKLHFENLVSHLEASYENLSLSFGHNLKRRPIVVVSRTHSQFEALRIHGDPFMPEGVGAFAMPRGSQLLPDSDLILVVKPDFLPVLNRTIYTHELVHIFQFDMIGANLFQRVTGAGIPDGWLFEAVADYKANQFAPYTRDDIRRQAQRIAAANATNPNADFPTLMGLGYGMSNPYTMGAMVFEFLEATYGTSKVDQLIVNVFKDRKQSFPMLLTDLSEGKFSTPEDFDRAHRDFWTARYALQSLKRSQPYSDTASGKGRQIMKFAYPYPLTSPAVSPDGKYISPQTISRKNGIVAAIVPALPRNDPEYVKQAGRKKWWLFGTQVPLRDPKDAFKILTKQLPPKPYEYIVGQELNTWPFNGSDNDWWMDQTWLVQVKDIEGALIKAKDTVKLLREEAKAEKKAVNAMELRTLTTEIERLEKAAVELRKVGGVSLIAFFARKNRDHALFIYDVGRGKLVKDIEIPLDQAFSPKFSPDGKRIYFSAAKNINRDIYSIDIDSKDTPVPERLTNGGVFNSAPAVSADGTKIAYVAFVGDFQKLFLLDLSTKEKKQITFGRFNDNSPRWSSDGKTLVYTSDSEDLIWNLYTLNLETSTSYQWTDFYGGVFTPMFVPGEDNRVVYSAYIEQDQYLIYVYPNFELFDIKLKDPIKVTQVKDTGESMEYAVRSEHAISERLDMRQIADPQKPPARWKLYGRNMYIGTSVYYGTQVYTHMFLQDMLGNRTYAATYAQSGYLRLYDVTYIDQSRRWSFAANANMSRFPLYYFLYSIEGKRPKYPDPNGDLNQFVLNSIWTNEMSATFYTQYPFSKWDRIELGIRPRKRSYDLPFGELPASEFERFRGQPLNLDVQTYDFFQRSSGQTNLGLSAAFIHDTVLSSYETLGPLHGNALRAQVEFGPRLNSRSSQYFTTQIDARHYRRLASGTLLALRLAGMKSNRPTGDFMLLGGTDSLRAYPYMSVVGNQVAYGSAELRIPLASAVLLNSIPFTVRGFAFGDYAISKFSQDLFPTRYEWSYGFGLQTWLIMPMNFEFARTKFSPKKWNFNFRIGFSF